MAVTSGIITAPVSVDDVRSAIGEGSTDVGTLCSSAKVNKWAKYKPIDEWKTRATAGATVGMLDDTINASKQVTAAGAQRRKNLFGMKIPCTILMTTGNYGSYPVGMLGWLLRNVIMGNCDEINYQHQSPSSPYRVTDFNGYSHYASPINPNYNSASKTLLEVPVEQINTDFDDTENLTIAIGWPNDTLSMTWNDMLAAIKDAYGLNGAWTFVCECYHEEHFTTSAIPTAKEIARYLGLHREVTTNSFVQIAPVNSAEISAESDVDTTTKLPSRDQFTVNADLTGLTDDGYYCFVYGFYFYPKSSPTTPTIAVLPPFKPIRRVWITSAFPFNMRCTAIGFYTTKLTWRPTDHTQANTCAGVQITYSNSDIWFKFECHPQTNPLTLTNANFYSVKALGSYTNAYEYETTDIKICDEDGAVIQNASVTLSDTVDTVLCVKCTGAVPVGITTQFVIKYKKDTADAVPTEMGTAFVNITKNS